MPVLLRHAGAVALCALVAACGSAPRAPDKAAPPAKKPSYYSDDGPPLAVPADLAAIPDAVPRDEPYHRYANRPYTVFGKAYVPVVNNDPVRERGLASWYGRKFHGQKTSNGEVYDMFAMTAAHKTFPLPSYARVTNVKTGQSVIVRVNDRGPFHEGRIIDLSYAAAARLGIAGPGSGMVEVERVFAGTQLAAAPAPAAAPATTVATPLAAAPAPQLVQAEVSVVTQDSAGFYLQLGAFSSRDNAESFRNHVAGDLPWLNEPIAVSPRDGLNRVRLGPYRNREEAQAIADKVRASLNFEPVISRNP
jgi:rare lipoprotein A